MVWIGLISYPYLWHWVLLTLLWITRGSSAGWQHL
jgi:peptidoglycan/LPS O-acetylase OafA/YrhL